MSLARDVTTPLGACRHRPPKAVSILALAPRGRVMAWDAANGRGAAMAFKQRVFSGVQPTGNLHLGNYLGAIQKFVELQKSHDCIYCVVDLHAITTWQDPAELPGAIREVTAAFIAAGIDPEAALVVQPSPVGVHAGV